MDKNNLSEYQIAELIYKHLSNTITAEEETTLNSWLSDGDNLALFNKITDPDNIKNKLSIYKQIETERVYNNLEEKISSANKKVVKLKIYQTLKYASVIVLFLSLGYFFKDNIFSKKQPLVSPVEHITLQLENGTVKVINEDGSFQVKDAKGNIVGTQTGQQIVYTKDSEKQTLVYNTLTVPYGKRFQILLSDGTNVHLNAGTSLKYPVVFIDGKNREVFLKGEAYFDVAKDKDHPFIVNSEILNVQVLGTEFNISSYPEDTESNVVLVEGSVNLKNAKNNTNEIVLKPGFKGSLNKNDLTNITSEPVITSIYTSWIDGELVFRNITFGNILKKMERHYNIQIINNNTQITNEKFNASFRNEPIEKILEYFKITYNINYTITDNKILIN